MSSIKPEFRKIGTGEPLAPLKRDLKVGLILFYFCRHYFSDAQLQLESEKGWMACAFPRKYWFYISNHIWGVFPKLDSEGVETKDL